MGAGFNQGSRITIQGSVCGVQGRVYPKAHRLEDHSSPGVRMIHTKKKKQFEVARTGLRSEMGEAFATLEPIAPTLRI